MPGYRGHSMGALVVIPPLFFLGNWLQVSLITLVAGALLVFLGALFPDIDTAGRGRRFFLSVLLFGVLACTSTQALWTAGVCAAVGLLALVSRHRSLFHNIYFLMLLTVGFMMWASHLVPYYAKELPLLGLCFLLGCLSHMMLDFGLKHSLRWR